MGAGKDARGGEGNGVVVDYHVNVSREGVEGGSTNDDAGVGIVDYQMWLGAEDTSAVHFYCVDDSGLVWTKDLGIPVRHARVVDMKETRG